MCFKAFKSIIVQSKLTRCAGCSLFGMTQVPYIITTPLVLIVLISAGTTVILHNSQHNSQGEKERRSSVLSGPNLSQSQLTVPMPAQC